MARTIPYVEDVKGFCRRSRAFAGGTWARLTPYTWGMGVRAERGPRGGKLYKRFPRMVWDVDGTLCKSRRTRDDSGAWAMRLAPIDGAVWCAHPAWADAHGYAGGTVYVKDGRPTRVEREGATLWVPSMGADYLAALTGIGE